jgi:hypothetical protein
VTDYSCKSGETPDHCTVCCHLSGKPCSTDCPAWAHYDEQIEYGYQFDDGEVWDGYADLSRIESEIDDYKRTETTEEAALGTYAGHFVSRRRVKAQGPWSPVSTRLSREVENDAP